MIAEQQKLIGGSANFVRRRFNQSEPNIARLVFESIQISRDPALRRRREQHGAVRELVVLRIVRIVKAGGVCERVNR